MKVKLVIEADKVEEIIERIEFIGQQLKEGYKEGIYPRLYWDLEGFGYVLKPSKT